MTEAWKWRLLRWLLNWAVAREYNLLAVMRELWRIGQETYTEDNRITRLTWMQETLDNAANLEEPAHDR